ncbi:MAG: cell division protein SepF [Micrococcales bacterium]|nr:MAG: cell division protein SepF [Micrococcales bacterium]PIE27318.1 MAG: cell division protein SepF [Micrococcales bacterium]
MTGALRKTMVYFGLAEEDDEFADPYRDTPVSEENTGAPAARDHNRAVAAADAPDGRADKEPTAKERSAVTTMRRERPAPTLVRDQPAGEISRIVTIHPRTYNDAKTIGEAYRDGVPVIMNLSDMSEADAKRLVDFSAGLVFGLRGSIERVTGKVFLLSPSNVEVAEQGSTSAANSPQSGFFNQS